MTAGRISREPGLGCVVDQLNNHDAVKGYYPLGEEVWEQTSGAGADAFARRQQHRAFNPRSRRSLRAPPAGSARSGGRASRNRPCQQGVA